MHNHVHRSILKNEELQMVHISFKMTHIAGPDPPYDHNFMLGSAVYKMLREHSEEASTILHDSPHRSAYVLSEIHRVRAKPKESWFRSGTSNSRIATFMGEALAPRSKLTIGQTDFQVNEIRLEEPVVRPGEFVTLSPILLTDKETGRSLVHDSDDYPRRLEEAINAQIRYNAKSAGLVRLLRVETQGVHKRTIRGRTVLTQKAHLLLDGPNEELNFLVNHGIGRSPALGFGMIVLNGSKPGPGFTRRALRGI